MFRRAMRGIQAGIVLALALAACASGETNDNKPSTTTGRTGTSIVPGAVQAKSAKYKMVGTVTIGNGYTSSTSYTKHGGIVGATQP
jgi:hypothetical protein